MRIISCCFIFCLFIVACRKPSWFTCRRIYSKTTVNKKFVVIIPSYNNSAWCDFALESLRLQTYRYFRVIYIDDCSSDGTADRVACYCREHQMHNVQLIKNKQRLGALANIYTAIFLCDDQEIIVSLDGDDWFAHDDVLAHLNRLYANSDVWMTYGQFTNWPTGEPGWGKFVPSDVVAKNTVRSYGFWFAQPRTYYAWLAKKVRAVDLIDPQTDNFFSVAGDVAFTIPLIEMAGIHVRFIKDVLYYRNVRNPINDFKCHQVEQDRVTKLILSKKAYTPLKLSILGELLP